jgi:hypothetical protein
MLEINLITTKNKIDFFIREYSHISRCLEPSKLICHAIWGGFGKSDMANNRMGFVSNTTRITFLGPVGPSLNT